MKSTSPVSSSVLRLSQAAFVLGLLVAVAGAAKLHPRIQDQKVQVLLQAKAAAKKKSAASLPGRPPAALAGSRPASLPSRTPANLQPPPRPSAPQAELRSAPLPPAAPAWEWPDSLPWFAFGLALAFVGLLGWRRAVAVQAQASLAVPLAEEASPSKRVERLLGELRSILASLEGAEVTDVCRRLDALEAAEIGPLVAGRTEILHRLGLQTGTAFFAQLAYGERMIHRAWTALADGHRAEAKASLEEAIAAVFEIEISSP